MEDNKNKFDDNNLVPPPTQPPPPPLPLPPPEQLNLHLIHARLRSLFSAAPLVSIAFASLTVNTALAAYRSRDDLPALSFLLFSYLDLLALAFLLRRFEQLGAASELTAEREARLKLAVWLLTAALILGFSCRVAAIVPLPAKVVIWAAAGSIASGGFYALFVRKKHT